MPGYYILTSHPSPVIENRLINPRFIVDRNLVSDNTQVIGSAQVGETLIWDRKPGKMRLGIGLV